MDKSPSKKKFSFNAPFGGTAEEADTPSAKTPAHPKGGPSITRGGLSVLVLIIALIVGAAYYHFLQMQGAMSAVGQQLG